MTMTSFSFVPTLYTNFTVSRCSPNRQNKGVATASRNFVVPITTRGRSVPYIKQSDGRTATRAFRSMYHDKIQMCFLQSLREEEGREGDPSAFVPKGWCWWCRLCGVDIF